MSSGQQFARRFDNAGIVACHSENGVITRVEPAPDADAGNTWLVPGLLDLQVNGYGGIDFQPDGLNEAALLKAVRAFRADGGHRFLLTLITGEWPRLINRLRQLRELRSQSAELQSTIAGWHIEGPFLSAEPGFHGAHNPAFMLDPTAARIRELRAVTGSDPLLLTLSPERPGSLEAIALAASLGIKISLGHTNATLETIRAAVSAGATGFTHLGNGCPRELDRHDNILWRVLSTPGLTVSLIPDAIHVSPLLFSLIHRLREADSIYYTTDAMSAAGAPPGRYTLGVVDVEVGADQIVRQPGKTNFAGSALCPLEGVTRAAEMLKCDWREAWHRASLVPARLMGWPAVFDLKHPANCALLKFTAGKLSVFNPV